MLPRLLVSFAAISGLCVPACGPTISIDEARTGTGGGEGMAMTAEDADSSDDGPSPDVPKPVCEPDAIRCNGSELGTWRLASNDAQVAAYLYVWPSDSPEEREFVSRWFVDDEEVEYCNRNGGYEPSGDLEGTYVLESDNLGGTFREQCGGDPGDHSLRLEFTRLSECDGEVLALTVTDSNGESLYSIEGYAVHCGCEATHDPFSGNGEPLPTDNCLSP